MKSHLDQVFGKPAGDSRTAAVAEGRRRGTLRKSVNRYHTSAVRRTRSTRTLRCHVSESCRLVDQPLRRPGPVVAVSDWMRAVPDQIAPYVPGPWTSLGIDGFGQSDGRAALRRHSHVGAAAPSACGCWSNWWTIASSTRRRPRTFEAHSPAAD